MGRARTGRVLVFALSTCATSTISLHAWSFDEDDEPSPPPAPAAPVSSVSLAGALGTPSLAADLKAPDAHVRASAVARAAEVAEATKEPSARDEAWKLVEAGAADNVGDDPDGSLLVRLAAARALASSPRKDARRALETLLRNPEPPKKVPTTPSPWAGSGWGPPPWGGPPPSGPWGPPPWSPTPVPQPPPKPQKSASPDLLRFVRETAAVSLAALGDHDTLLARARAKDDVESARAAIAALIASPPPSLAAVLPKGEGTLPHDTVELFAKLGDPRAADPLLRTATGKDPLDAAIALLALARMRDGRASSVARSVPADARSELRLAAIEALAELGEPGADVMIVAAIGDAKIGSEAKRLAIRFPSPSLVAVLEPMAKAGDASAVAALGRIGEVGVAPLSALARSEGPLGDVAAHQLAISPLSSAGDALASLLGTHRRRAVRAGAVRVARIGSVPSAIKSAAKELAASSVAADRFVGTLFRAVRDLDDARAALASDDPIHRRAGAAALGAHGRIEAAEIARAHLAAHASSEDLDVLRALAAVAARAVDGSIARDVPISTTVLATWLAEDGVASPLAAFLLAARGGDAESSHVTRALASESLDVRVAALLGLGVAPDRSTTGALALQLAERPQPALRRAAIRALVARADPAAARAIAEAKSRDPDAEVRAIAKSASPSAPKKASPLLLGFEVVQLSAKAPEGTKLVATVAGADGLAVPAIVDPDGFVVAFRVAPAPVRVDVRPAPLAAAPKAPKASPSP